MGPGGVVRTASRIPGSPINGLPVGPLAWPGGVVGAINGARVASSFVFALFIAAPSARCSLSYASSKGRQTDGFNLVNAPGTLG